MTVAGSAAPEVYGEVPQLEGAVCTGLLVQSFLSAGELVSPANAVFIQANGVWHRLVLDAGTIHWRIESSQPVSWGVAEQDWEYPLSDVGSAAGLVGDRIFACVARATGSGCLVEIAFHTGRRFVLEEQADVVRYAVI